MSANVNPAGSGPSPLRQRVDEFVGLFFYGTMLKSVREHPLTHAKFGMGGRGENVFGSQLDQELAQRAGQGSHSSLSDAIVRQIGGKSAGRLPLPTGTNVMSAGGMANAIGQTLDVRN
jgi:Rod binding domain-containing protein